MSDHYNPHRLELTLARIAAWSCWGLLVTYGLACLLFDFLDNQPEKVRWLGALIIFFAGLLSSEAEEDAEKKAAEFEKSIAAIER